MRKNSTSRNSTLNPVRISVFEREDEAIGRSDTRRTHIAKARQSQNENSQIPKPRIRSSSIECATVRRSNLKVSAKTPLHQQHHPGSHTSSTTPLTPRVSSNRLHSESSLGTAHRSPSAERARGFNGKGSRKDTRPLLDKGYQAVMLNKIDQYFIDIEQISLLNPNGSLKPITLKMFVETTGCLSRLLDIKQDITINNYMEEVPKIGKKVHYPGIVTKSWLKTANAMHSWPQVLGWLSWLVDICLAKDLAASAFETEQLPFLDDVDQCDSNKNRFLALLKFYAAWNENSDEEIALVEQYFQQINNESGDVEKDKLAVMRSLDDQKAKIQVVDQQINEIDKQISDLNQVVVNIRQENCEELEYLDSLEKSTQRILLEIDQLNANSKGLEEQIHKDSIRQTELQKIIENQPMSAEERDDIIKQCSEKQNHLHQFDNHIKDIEKELYALDIKLAGVNQNLYKAILAYNKDIIMHLDCDVDIGATLEELQMPETKLFGTHFIEELKQKEIAMFNVKERIRKQISQTTNSTEAYTNELESLEDKLKMIRTEKMHHVEKINEQKITVQQIQRMAKEMEVKLKEQIKNVESDLVRLQRSMPDLESASNELAERRDKYEAVVRKRQFIEKSADRFFNKFYDVLANHRNNLSTLLKNLPDS